ncbi:MAG: TlpA family protein disulfide reductase [Stenotrophobium sp.]
MKRFIPVLLSLLTLSIPSFGAGAASIRHSQPLAILIAADWCTNCKIIKPKLHDAYQGFEDKIDFVTLDVTDGARLAQAQKQADKLGQPGLLLGHFATGWVDLVDRNGKQAGELRQDMSVPQMRKTLQALLDKPG